MSGMNALAVILTAKSGYRGEEWEIKVINIAFSVGKSSYQLTAEIGVELNGCCGCMLRYIEKGKVMHCSVFSSYRYLALQRFIWFL
ncbi:Uncharacterized protein TCM_005032 [Theobroma cacao]|uniref:Uncharacterized protein n=1 Tax=Theobroma cacao TaxID=3641 RepID=A0A061DS81_THECC|nr:Uncharacterized protein TCM_005032 [Theobroma cacao]